MPLLFPGSWISYYFIAIDIYYDIYNLLQYLPICNNSPFVDGQTIGQTAGEFIDGQTFGQPTGEFIDGQTVGQPTGEFVDGQIIVQLSVHVEVKWAHCGHVKREGKKYVHELDELDHRIV